MMSEKINIQKHWQKCNLQEIGKVINGDRGKNYPSRAHYVASGIPFISAGNIEQNFIDTNSLNFITEQKYDSLNNGKLKEGDIIYCLRGSLGKCSIFNLKKGAISSSLCILRLNDDMIGKFVYYYLCSPFGRDEILKHDNGTAQPNLSAKNFSNYIIFKPPLLEQQAIVSKIEELLSDLESGKQQLQIAQQQLKVYRQSLLKWAFEGKLTNKNLKEGELPKGWKLVTVDEIGKVKGGKRLPKGDAYSEEPTKYPYLRVTDFENQTINQKKLKFLTASTQAQIKNYIISKADVFISIAGTIGTTGTIPENLDGANLTENAAKITDLKNIYNKYLSQFLASMEGQSQIKEYTKTTTQPKLSLFRIEKIELPLPPLEEQQRIVAELESKLTVCDKIEETISQSLQQAETLRQSILKQAFEGKLIQTEVFTGKKKELV
jgi:type I restriction enzyme, S subunit